MSFKGWTSSAPPDRWRPQDVLRALLFWLLCLGAPPAFAETVSPSLDLYVFWGQGCPHCEAQQPFLAELAARHPGLVIHSHEVWLSDADHGLIGSLARVHDIEAGVVPTVFVGGRPSSATAGR